MRGQYRNAHPIVGATPQPEGFGAGAMFMIAIAGVGLAMLGTRSIRSAICERQQSDRTGRVGTLDERYARVGRYGSRSRAR